MRKLALAATAAAALVGGALAAEEPRPYDRRLAQAAAEIVASRIGGLRGGFDMQDTPDLSAWRAALPKSSSAHRSALPPPGVWRNGLAIAVERKSPVSPEL